MKLVDLTHLIEPSMTVYPGTPPPRIMPAALCQRDGYRETSLAIYSHIGTHIDAPAHVYEAGKTLDAYPADFFVGRALVIDASQQGGELSLSCLPTLNLSQYDFLLFYTGWDAYWRREQYKIEYPHFSPKLLDFIAAGAFRGIGIDMLSVDLLDDAELPVHKRLLAKDDFIIMENLCGLAEIAGLSGCLTALPLLFAGADGAPARIVFAAD